MIRDQGDRPRGGRTRMRSALLMVLTACGVLAEGGMMDRMQHCSTHCSQEVQCRARSHSTFEFCKETATELNRTTVQGITISTVMKCEQEQRCSPHLRVTALVQLTKQLRGLALCMLSAGMLETCRAVTFPRRNLHRLTGQQVLVHDDCFDVRPGLDVHVTLKTIPSYCNLTWSHDLRVPGCNNVDLRKNVPECISGTIEYVVDSERRELSVKVSGILEDWDYRLRLCLKGFICRGTSEHILIKKEEPMKNATLRYSRALPCLCIEGWSSMPDARRTQVCPFRNNTGELWKGVTFDAEQEALSWEPECPVEAVVSLCQSAGELDCHDLANSSQVVSSKKVVFSKVDPHPKLCVKFSTAAGSWVKCPFVRQNAAWDLTFSSVAQHQTVTVSSYINTEVVWGLCRNSKPMECDQVASLAVEKFKPVDINLTMETCGPGVCVQVRRTDVNFSVQVLHCNFQCSDGYPDEEKTGNGAPWLLPSLCCLTLTLLLAFSALMIFKKLN
ncbi:interleukin-17 receptor E-like protein isoform X2 [Paramormyrops kingsleyae]|uniref:interleukin-17 receptor E-like protein isoform X2 n=1 Tax=Paramormyrops kingsleyae TaxID=1676925 RepID=UPI003B97261E